MRFHQGADEVEHLLGVAAEAGIEDAVRSAFGKMVVGSIGPTTSETLEEYGLKADFEPSHPKMGLLVNEAAVALQNRDRKGAGGQAII